VGHGLAAAALSLALLAGGCDQRDPGAVAVSEAARVVSTATNDGARRSASEGHVRQSLQSALDKVRDVARSDSPSTGAAGMIAGKARAAIADLDASAALEPARENQLLVQRLRGALDQYTGAAGLVGALSGEDLAPDIAENASALKAAEARLEQARTAAQSAEGAASAIKAQIDRGIAQAQTLRNRAAELRLEASKTGATAAVTLIEQAARAGQEADSLDGRGVVLLAQQTAKMTEAESARAQLDALTVEVARLNSEKSALEERRATTATRLAEAQAGMSGAAGQVDSLAGAVLSNHESKVRPAQEKALSGLREAMDLFRSAAGKLQGKDAQSGKLGTLQLSASLADQLAGQARTEEQIATAMSLLANAQPALANAAKYRASAAEATAKFETLIGEAREGYKKVREDLDSVSDPKLKEGLSTALAKLELLASKQGISTEQVTPEAFRDPAAVAAEKATAGVRRAIDAYHDAARAGDAAAVETLIQLDDPAVKAAFLEAESIGRVMQSLEDETKGKFGKGFLELMPGGQMMAPMVDAAKAVKERTSADYNFALSEDGKTATATAKKPVPGEPVTRLVLVGDAWKITLDKATGEMVKMGATMMGPLKSAFESILQDLRDGKIEDEQQLVATIKTKLSSAMPGMPGGDTK
jgi:chromosome segregation ATPase